MHPPGVASSNLFGDMLYCRDAIHRVRCKKVILYEIVADDECRASDVDDIGGSGIFGSFLGSCFYIGDDGGDVESVGAAFRRQFVGVHSAGN